MVSPYAEFTVYHPKPGLRTAAAVRRQTIRRHEGAAFDAIFLLLIGVHEGGRCQSPRRSRGRRPARPAVPARSGSRRKGQRLLPDTPSPVGCGACTLGFGQSATFHLTGGRGGTPDSSSLSVTTLGLFGLASLGRRPLFADTRSNWEECPWLASAEPSCSFLLLHRE